MDDVDRKLLNLIQQFPVTAAPFAEVGGRMSLRAVRTFKINTRFDV